MLKALTLNSSALFLFFLCFCLLLVWASAAQDCLECMWESRELRRTPNEALRQTVYIKIT